MSGLEVVVMVLIGLALCAGLAVFAVAMWRG